MKTETVYLEDHGDMTIMLLRDEEDCWSVFYKAPGYAFHYAFGLPDAYTPGGVEQSMAIAHGNADINRRILFTEEG